MKVAIITTTIRVPALLELYRKFNREAIFIIAGDKKTPHQKLYKLVKKLGNAQYLSDEDQEKMGYEVSKIIGWNSIQRRNIAILEAIKQKSDIIITLDDDNIPINSEYFSDVISRLSNPFNGLLVTSENHWFNVGNYFTPKIYHRGYPHELWNDAVVQNKLTPVTDKKAGIVAGMWYGDPDINAIERMVVNPRIYTMPEILKTGLLVDHNIYSPFNSQNTAYLKALVPLLFVLPGIGRYDDIWASFIAEKILSGSDYYLYFGKPFVWQERNVHNFFHDLEEEMYGLKYTMDFCRTLDKVNMVENDIIGNLHKIFLALNKNRLFLPIISEFGLAWCRDLNKVM